MRAAYVSRSMPEPTVPYHARRSQSSTAATFYGVTAWKYKQAQPKNRQTLSREEIQKAGKLHEDRVTELKNRAMKEFDQALIDCKKPIGVQSIRAAMRLEGQLPLCKESYSSGDVTYELEAAVTHRPEEQVQMINQAFKQQVQEQINQVEKELQEKEKIDQEFLSKHGVPKGVYHEIFNRVMSDNGREIDKIKADLVKVREERFFLTHPAAHQTLPSYLVKWHTFSKQVQSILYEDSANRQFEVGIWLYPKQKRQDTHSIQNVLQEHTETLKKKMQEMAPSIKERLSRAIDLHNKPYSYPVVTAMLEMEGKFPLREEAFQLSKEEASYLGAFVTRHPDIEDKEIQRAFDKQLKQALAGADKINSWTIYHDSPAVRRWHALKLDFRPMIGSAPDNLLEGTMSIANCIAETRDLLLGRSFSKA